MGFGMTGEMLSVWVISCDLAPMLQSKSGSGSGAGVLRARYC